MTTVVYRIHATVQKVDKMKIYRDHIVHLKDSLVCLRDDYPSSKSRLIDTVMDVFQTLLLCLRK